MPKLISQLRFQLLRRLSEIWLKINEQYNLETRLIGNRLPVGGTPFIDLFFRLEGLREVMSSLRLKKPLAEAIKIGQEASRYAVKQWNKQRARDYQVHRWEETAFDWLFWTVTNEARAVGFTN